MTIKSRRIIRDVPTDSVEPVPPGTMLAYGQLDYIDDGEGDAPADAVYIAHMDESGAVEVVKDDFISDVVAKPVDRGGVLTDDAPKRHTFAGWPVPGELVDDLAAEPLEVAATKI